MTPRVQAAGLADAPDGAGRWRYGLGGEYGDAYGVYDESGAEVDWGNAGEVAGAHLARQDPA